MYIFCDYILYKILSAMLLLSIIVFFILLIINLFEKINDKSILIKFISLIFIFFIAFYSNNQWCYLTLIIILAGNTNLISQDILQLVKSLNSNKIDYKPIINSKEQEDKKQKRDEDIKNYVKEKIDVSDANFKNFLKKGEIEYITYEEKIISWFKKRQFINFEQNMVVRYGNDRVFYPDGFKSTKNVDLILEIKVINNNNSLYDILGKCKSIYNEYEKIYKKANKDFFFFVAVVIDSTNDNDKIKNIEYESFCNFKMYIFDKNLDLMYEK